MTTGSDARALGPVRPGASRVDDLGVAEVGVSELSREECIALLGTAVIGRFVLTVGALPAVVPVTFALDGDVAVCCTSGTSRLARSAGGAVLALQADDIDVVTRSGWSVVATGVADVVRDPAEVHRLACLVDPWITGQLDVAIRLPLTVLTGRRVRATPDGRPLAGLPTASPA